MQTEDILKTAHIHLDHAVYRVYVEDSSLIDIKMMNEDENKPSFIFGVGTSNDSARNQHSILVEVNGDLDMNELADWINSYL